MKRFIIVVVLLSVCLLPVISEAAPKVYPVKRVFGFRQNALAGARPFKNGLPPGAQREKCARREVFFPKNLKRRSKSIWPTGRGQYHGRK